MLLLLFAQTLHWSAPLLAESCAIQEKAVASRTAMTTEETPMTAMRAKAEATPKKAARKEATKATPKKAVRKEATKVTAKARKGANEFAKAIWDCHKYA